MPREKALRARPESGADPGAEAIAAAAAQANSHAIILSTFRTAGTVRQGLGAALSGTPRPG
jgi:hypothetical protein